MKIIEHSYGADLNWVDDLAKQIKGTVKGNHILVPESIHTGTRYILDCGNGIVAYYVDVQYNRDFHFIQKNTSDDFVGIYYNLTEGEATLSCSNFIYKIGRWDYNLTTIDGGLKSDYYVKKGSKSFLLGMFIKKETIRQFVKENNFNFPDLDKIIDPAINTMIRFDRMSSDSYNILADFRKQKVDNPTFNLSLKGTVHLLFVNYLKKMSLQRIVIQKVNEYDLKNIIAIQMFLIENIEGHFPSIKLMASKANMSVSKFKTLFKKITGSTPNTFFIENKLQRSKELLEEKQLSITQISDRLHFSSNSYFAARFKKMFDTSPKLFIKQL